MRNLLAKYIAIQSMLKSEKGATMVEYALMVALIAVVCAIAVGAVGTNANIMFQTIRDRLAAP